MIQICFNVEFSQHEIISSALGADFYFAHPYHSWERGLNENTNGLIRPYILKGASRRTKWDNDIVHPNKMN